MRVPVLSSSMPDLESYYDRNNEKDRLDNSPSGQLEFFRSREILLRYLIPPPATIIEVGGAAGRYSCWLATLGYHVHLVDLMPALVEQARTASQAQPNYPLASCAVGDARALDFADSFADAVLLFGPLYHLTEREDRLTALREVARVLKPGAVLFTAHISRFASAFDGFRRGLIRDPEFLKILRRDLQDGQHRNHTENLDYFTDAYFHLPEEIRSEFEDSGLAHIATLPVEGIAYLLGNLHDLWQNESEREILLTTLRDIEAEPSLLSATSHLIGVARRA